MKKLCLILSLTLILFFMVGCQDKEAMAELEAMKAQAEVEEQNKELVKRYLKGADSYNMDSFDEVCSADCKFYFPGSFDPINLEQFKQMVAGFYEAFEDMTHRLDDIIADGDKVLARTTNSVVHTKEFNGIAPTGNTIWLGELHFFRISEGKIVELWVQEDFLWMWQQLGM
ncbi:ester cyclase, partial [Acidobacteriota bacterium]